MAKREASRGEAGREGASGDGERGARFARGKRLLVLSAAAIAGGLAVAGTIHRTAGGALAMLGWLLAVGALHLLGRAGVERGRSRDMP